MDIAVHGRRVEVPEQVRHLATSKVEQLGKYLNGMERAELYFSDGKKGRSADPVTCELMMEGHGHVVRAQGAGASPDAALAAAIDKAGLRLARLKRRLVARSRPRHKASRGLGEGELGEGEPSGAQGADAGDIEGP